MPLADGQTIKLLDWLLLSDMTLAKDQTINAPIGQSRRTPKDWPETKPSTTKNLAGFTNLLTAALSRNSCFETKSRPPPQCGTPFC